MSAQDMAPAGSDFASQTDDGTGVDLWTPDGTAVPLLTFWSPGEAKRVADLIGEVFELWTSGS